MRTESRWSCPASCGEISQLDFTLPACRAGRSEAYRYKPHHLQGANQRQFELVKDSLAMFIYAVGKRESRTQLEGYKSP